MTKRVSKSLICLSLMLVLFPVAVLAQVCKESIVATTPDGNFTPHQNGTALHKTTGLMWMRCSLGQVWDGKDCRGAAEKFPWQGALQASQNFRFAGYSDWRLPNKNELESLVEERCSAPAINATVFPAAPSAYFWTSSPYVGLSSGAWSVDFAFGSINASVKTASIHVRLVRGGL
jgi:hypothetical protein